MKEEKKPEETKNETPPPPQEIVLQVYMHCEGCARKVHRWLKGFEGQCVFNYLLLLFNQEPRLINVILFLVDSLLFVLWADNKFQELKM